jgi:hypothetical protein
MRKGMDQWGAEAQYAIHSSGLARRSVGHLAKFSVAKPYSHEW